MKAAGILFVILGNLLLLPGSYCNIANGDTDDIRIFTLILVVTGMVLTSHGFQLLFI